MDRLLLKQYVQNKKSVIVHVPLFLASSIAVSCSMSSDKLNAIFLRSIRKNVFTVEHLIHVYIIFIKQRER